MRIQYQMKMFLRLFNGHSEVFSTSLTLVWRTGQSHYIVNTKMKYITLLFIIKGNLPVFLLFQELHVTISLLTF